MLSAAGTKLADERAELLKSRAQKEEQNSAPAPPQPLIGYGIPRFSSPVPAQDTVVIAQLRQDLSRAQQERGDLQNKLNIATRELEDLKAKGNKDSRRITQLTAAVQQLTTKVRDREEELKGKAKLVEDVQDENVTLNLQLNVSEDRAEKLKQENKDLVDRWMARMGQEAEKMNEQGKFK